MISGPRRGKSGQRRYPALPNEFRKNRTGYYVDMSGRHNIHKAIAPVDRLCEPCVE